MFALYAADKVANPKDAKSVVEDALDSGKTWAFWQDYLGNSRIS